MPGRGNKGATATFGGTERVHRARLYTLLKSIWIEMMTDDAFFLDETDILCNIT